MEQEFFIALHKNDDVWKHSSSGGAFTAITDAWLEKHQDKSVIYGCILDENLKAVHIRATDKTGRNLMRGSKYISSDTSGAFQMVENDLRDGLCVIFSGTPCQIAGLKSYLKVKKIECTDNLLTIDVICHGVGSNRFFEDYIKHLEKRRKSKAISCKFRAKSRPKKITEMEITFQNGKKYNSSTTKFDWFYSVYFRKYILRPSCFRCKYATKERISDITIADNWGQGQLFARSSSLIKVNTILGHKILKRSFKDMEYKLTDSENLCQPHMVAPAKKPDVYDEFWSVYEKDGYMTAQKYVGNNTFKGRIKYFAAYVLNKLHLIEIVKKLKR